MFWVCDGNLDCPEGSDEADCSCESYSMLQCTTALGTAMCFPLSWICAGSADCFAFDKTWCEEHSFEIDRNAENQQGNVNLSGANCRGKSAAF